MKKLINHPEAFVDETIEGGLDPAVSSGPCTSRSD
jgi:hypothetical protein